MRTTIEIDEELLKAAAELAGEKNKGKVVNRALEEYVRRRRIEKLLASMGTWDLDLDDWYEFRHQGAHVGIGCYRHLGLDTGSPSSRFARKWRGQKLVVSRQAAMVGMVLVELLRGARTRTGVR